MTEANCLFCRIVKKEIAAEILYENEDTIAFLDVHPRAPGHTMVIPKDHAENIINLENAKILPTFLTVKKVTDILLKALKPRGFTIGVNHGKISGQTIDHLHIHIIPRFDGDNGGSIHSVVNNPPKESLAEIANKIKKSF